MGLGLPRGHREEQPGASGPLGKASALWDHWLVGREQQGKPRAGQLWGERAPVGVILGQPPWEGWLRVPVRRGAPANPYNLGRDRQFPGVPSGAKDSPLEGRMNVFLANNGF